MPTDYMGSDSSVVQAARVSYGAGTTKPSDDRTLVRYLRRHRHTTPSEQVELAAMFKTPMFVWPRQGARHRTMDREGVLGAFVPLRDMYEIPDEEFRAQSKGNRQGRGEELDNLPLTAAQHALKATGGIQEWAARELKARGLPEHVTDALMGVGHYTRGSAKVDLHNALHFLGLRNDPHAQREIQLHAQQWERFVRAVAPVTVEAFEDYQRNAVTFMAPELPLVRKLLAEGKAQIPFGWYVDAGWTKRDPDSGEQVRNREAEELDARINRLLGEQKSETAPVDPVVKTEGASQ
jgi:thymidylate synthase (FAD)